MPSIRAFDKSIRQEMSAKKNLDTAKYKMYVKILKDKIDEMIDHDLTVGKRNKNLREFTRAEIDTYKQKYDVIIKVAIRDMIQNHYEENDLESLKNAKPIQISQYLYHIVDFAGISDAYHKALYGNEDDTDEESESEEPNLRKRKREDEMV